MVPADETRLKNIYPSLARLVGQLPGSISTDEAWMTAGAMFAYTGNAHIPLEIVLAAGRTAHDYPKRIGHINDALRGNVLMTAQLSNALSLLKNIEHLPAYTGVRQLDPTRMMDSYLQIDVHYAVGNVLLMAEVGSVSRHRPAPGLYQKQYRIHITGGLKDITFINPEQQELVYAPGTPYRVERRRVGKVKDKKGPTGRPQAHTHIYLQYAPEDRAQAHDLANVRPA